MSGSSRNWLNCWNSHILILWKFVPRRYALSPVSYISIGIHISQSEQKSLFDFLKIISLAICLLTISYDFFFIRKPGSRLNMIIDVTGASSYHGFLPVLVRTCITTLTSPQPDGQPFPLPLATALFSFLYHLASYEAGGEALVSCGMMESLLKVINWPGSELEHITVNDQTGIILFLPLSLSFCSMIPIMKLLSLCSS